MQTTRLSQFGRHEVTEVCCNSEFLPLYQTYGLEQVAQMHNPQCIASAEVTEVKGANNYFCKDHGEKLRDKRGENYR